MRDESFNKKLFGTWYPLMKPIVHTERFNKLIDQLNLLYVKSIFPVKGKVFRAFKATPMHKLRVVIVGEEPYADKYSTGLAYGQSEQAFPIATSLKVILDSIEDDYYDGLNLNRDFSLEYLAKQGVMLYNTLLTADFGKPYAHKEIWEGFTRVFLTRLANNSSGIVFCLVGKSKDYAKYIQGTENHVVFANDPGEVKYGEKWKFSFKEVDKFLTNKINW